MYVFINIYFKLRTNCDYSEDEYIYFLINCFVYLYILFSTLPHTVTDNKSLETRNKEKKKTKQFYDTMKACTKWKLIWVFWASFCTKPDLLSEIFIGRYIEKVLLPPICRRNFPYIRKALFKEIRRLDKMLIYSLAKRRKA